MTAGSANQHPRRTKLPQRLRDWPCRGREEAGLAAGMGGEGEGWGEPRACGCPAPGQWTARAALPISLWRDRIHSGPGGCPPLLRWPPLLRPSRCLLVPESWSHWSLVLCVKLRAGEPKGTGELPRCLGPRERSGLGASGGNRGALLRVPRCGSQTRTVHGCRSLKVSVLGSWHVGEGGRQGGRPRQCISCVPKRKSVALDSINTPHPPNTFPHQWPGPSSCWERQRALAERQRGSCGGSSKLVFAMAAEEPASCRKEATSPRSCG